MFLLNQKQGHIPINALIIKITKMIETNEDDWEVSLKDDNIL